jgi:DNA-binding NtrC family response regulator
MTQSILVLDDEFDILTTIKSFLQKHGFHVYAFTDPHLALEHFQKNATIYYLIISDIRMPQMNGFEFIKKVKEIKPKVKVFFMTAFEINDIEFRRVLPSTRIDEFIQKPILLERLNALVQNHTST